MSGHILVVGDVMTDIVAVTEGPPVIGSDRRASIRLRPGGSGANLAAWLGKLGVNVMLAARIGASDKLPFEDHFRLFNIEPHLALDPALPSGVLIDIVMPDGERSFLTDRGANLALNVADLPLSLLDKAALLALSGYSFFAEQPRAAVRALFAEARRRGIATVIDPGTSAFILEAGVDNFIEWTKDAQYFFPNENEARALTGSNDLETQMRRLGAFYDHVVIKRGAAGAALGGRDGILAIVTAPKVKVIDTTGAGDAFAAGFIAALASGADQETCLRRGVETGSAAVQMIGAQPEFLQERA